VDWEFGVEEQAISDELRLVIFRIVQDALKNVEDHSKSGHVRVSLIGENEYLMLSIEDDGVGFNVSRVRSQAVTNGGLGLLSIERRAELSGGSFKIESTVGRGTVVSVRWPLRASSEQ
jgi:two-component system NarL family sensor kinase